MTDTTRIGSFWFVPEGAGYLFFRKSKIFDQVEIVDGFKFLSSSQADLWKRVVKKHEHLRNFDHAYFPNGMVGWREIDDTFIMFADPRILEAGLDRMVTEKWDINRSKMIKVPYDVSAFPRHMREAMISPKQVS